MFMSINYSTFLIKLSWSPLPCKCLHWQFARLFLRKMASLINRHNPPYPDAFHEKISDDNDRMCLLKSKWDTVQQFTFPSR